VRPLPLLLAALCGVALGLGLFTLWYGEATAYLSNDPQACVNCHIMREQFDGWVKSPHHRVAACNDCHVPHSFIPKYVTKALNGYNHSRAFTLQDFPEPIRITDRNAEILQDNCVGCHRDFVDPVLGVPHGEGNEVEQPDCARCHRGVGHGPVT